ncbi:hypothetical protein AIF45_14170 [Salmonella enterica subsp. salamae]|uniref:Uncharacterized protein n=1 Tax=Salmonella enterica subsp. salamae TaxID=59202 RepID=A0A6C8YDW0_SALER|nr:hypothetical protein [Salmonella enterica subsp. salamae]
MPGRNASVKWQYKSFVTVCEALLRLSAGRPATQVDRVVIPEVLIGGINVIVDHTNYTNLRRDAQVFFLFRLNL